MAKTKAKREVRPVWTRRPDPEDAPMRWEMVRCGPRGLTGLIILSGDLVGAYTHYLNGRTQPCGGTRCEPCDSNVQRRWYGYLGVANKAGERRGIVEVTASASGPIDAYFSSHRSLRGGALTLWRAPIKANGRLYCKVEESAVLVDGLPEAPDLKRLLEKMWRVNVLALCDEELERDVRMHVAANVG